MSTPTVSVVVPVFNGARFLGDALDSVFAQRCPPSEVIVVDDGSTDGSGELARARGVCVLVQPNGGMAAARNAGVASSRGELIAFLDHDDVWLPGKLERQVAALREEPELGIVYAHAELAVEPGARLPRWLREYADRPMPGYLPSTLLVRRQVFDAVGGFDPAFAVGADSDWLLRAKDAGIGFRVLPDVLVRYRIHGGNSIYQQRLVLEETARMFHRSAARQRAARRPEAG